MFGTKKYKVQKGKKFKTDNERKRFFAIKNYYAKKSAQSSVIISNKKKK